MKVLHYLPHVDLAAGGVVRAVLDMTSMLAGAVEECSVAYRSGPDIAAIDRGVGRLAVETVAELVAAVGRYDCVHLHGVWSREHVTIGASAREVGVATVCSPHGMLDDWCLAQKPLRKSAFLRVYRRHFRSDVAIYHCTAEGERRQVTANLAIGPERTAVCPLYLADRPPVRSSPPTSVSDVPTILFLGRIDPKKGIEHLIDAIPDVMKRLGSVRVEIAGPATAAYRRRLMNRIRRRGLERVVEMPGMLRGVEKERAFERAGLFVLPTYQENFGIALVESMMRNVPTLTTRGTDIWPELERHGAIIAEQTPTKLAESIVDVMTGSGRDGPSSPDLDGLRRWLDRDRIAETMVAMYEGVAAGSDGHPA